MSEMIAGIAIALVAVGYVLQPLLRGGEARQNRAAVNADAPSCGECGARPELDAVFCSNCGRALGNG